jgi:hypothetical protein
MIMNALARTGTNALALLPLSLHKCQRLWNSLRSDLLFIDYSAQGSLPAPEEPYVGQHGWRGDDAQRTAAVAKVQNEKHVLRACAQTHTNKHTHTHTHTHTRANSRTREHTNTRLYAACTNVTHASTHTRTHIPIYTHTRSLHILHTPVITHFFVAMQHTHTNTGSEHT